MPSIDIKIQTNTADIIKALIKKGDAAIVGLKKGTKLAGVIIESKARSYFKTGGPGGSWPKLKPDTTRIKSARGQDKGILKQTTGLLHSLTTQQKGLEVYVGTNKDYAKYHEFGYKGLPRRSFLRPAAAETEKEQVEAVMNAIKKEAKL